MTTYRNHLLVLVVISLITLLSVGLFNYSIDPFGIWRYDNINFSAKYPRLYKSYKTINRQAEILLLGNSRVFYGINPLSLESKYTTINLGLPAATQQENYHLLEQYLKNNNKPIHVMIGIDISPGFVEPAAIQNTFSLNRFSYPRLEMLKESIFSSSALALSLDTIMLRRKNTPQTVVNEFGYALYGNGNVDHDELYREKLYSYIKNNWPKLRFLKDQSKTKNFTENLYWLGKAADLLRKNNIPSIFFINPVHIDLLSSLCECENPNILKNWKLFVQQSISPDDTVHILDFSILNQFTSLDPNSDLWKEYYYEPSHYTPKLGKIIFTEMSKYLTNPSTSSLFCDDIVNCEESIDNLYIKSIDNLYINRKKQALAKNINRITKFCSDKD